MLHWAVFFHRHLHFMFEIVRSASLSLLFCLKYACLCFFPPFNSFRSTFEEKHENSTQRTPIFIYSVMFSSSSFFLFHSKQQANQRFGKRYIELIVWSNLKKKMNIADSTMSASGEASGSCGGAVAGSIFGTIACIIVLAIGAWLLYKKYWKNKTGKKNY